MDEITLLTPAAVAERLGVTSARVIQLANAGRIKAIRNSLGWRQFPLEEVERFERERRKQGR